MKIYEKRIETIEREILVTRQCDLCGRKAKTATWNSGIYEVNETEISIIVKQKEGASYPESGSGTKYEIDLCPECFKNRLIPWLKGQGGTIQEDEWEY